MSDDVVPLMDDLENSPSPSVDRFTMVNNGRTINNNHIVDHKHFQVSAVAEVADQNRPTRTVSFALTHDAQLQQLQSASEQQESMQPQLLPPLIDGLILNTGIETTTTQQQPLDPSNNLPKPVLAPEALKAEVEVSRFFSFLHKVRVSSRARNLAISWLDLAILGA